MNLTVMCVSEGAALAKVYGAAFEEISSSLSLNMDHLITDLMRMINCNLKLLKQEEEGAERSRSRSPARGLLSLLRSSTRRLARSCEELFTRLTA